MRLPMEVIRPSGNLPLNKGCHLIVVVPDSMTLVVDYQLRVCKMKMISCLKVTLFKHYFC